MSICGRRVDNPQQVIDIIIYETVGASLALDSSNTVLSEEDQAKFAEHLERYLRGEGHPMHKDWGLGHVDQESRHLVRQDRVMRCKRLLSLTMGSELLPSSTRQRISVRFSVLTTYAKD